jgi:hypothetical protein
VSAAPLYHAPVVSRRTPALALLAATLALAGCGGDSGNGGGGGDDGGGGAGAVDKESASYEAAFDICRGGVKETADAYAVEATNEAVAQIVVEQVSGGSVRDEASARQGCLDALAAAESG